MREKVWINRIRIAVGLSLAVGIFVNNRELTPGWIAFLLALIGLGELAAAPGVKGKSDGKDSEEDQGMAEPDGSDKADSSGVRVPRSGNRSRTKSIRLAI